MIKNEAKAIKSGDDLLATFKKVTIEHMKRIALKYYPGAKFQVGLPTGAGFMYDDLEHIEYCQHRKPLLVHRWRSALREFEAWLSGGLMDYLDVEVLGVEVVVAPSSHQASHMRIEVRAGVWYKDPFQD